MGALRARPTVATFLVLAALTFAGALANSHAHEAHAAVGDLPTFAAGHEQPDRTVHVEEATHIEASSCVGCLLRQRQRASESLDAGSAGFEPGIAALAIGDDPVPARSVQSLPAQRAPPTA